MFVKKEYDRIRYQNNKEIIKKKQKEYYYNDINKQRLIEQRYRATHTERYLLNSCKYRAKRRNIEFTINEEDITIPSHCPYLGIELTNIRGSGRLRSNPSIDRIDNSRGYIKGNIRVVSNLANIMKQNVTEEQLIAFAKGVLKLHGRVIHN